MKFGAENDSGCRSDEMQTDGSRVGRYGREEAENTSVMTTFYMYCTFQKGWWRNQFNTTWEPCCLWRSSAGQNKNAKYTSINITVEWNFEWSEYELIIESKRQKKLRENNRQKVKLTTLGLQWNTESCSSSSLDGSCLRWNVPMQSVWDNLVAVFTEEYSVCLLGEVQLTVMAPLIKNPAD